MKGKFPTILLAVFIGILAGLVFLISINLAVQAAFAPTGTAIHHVIDGQNLLDQKMTSLSAQLQDVQTKLDAATARMNAPAPAPAPQAQRPQPPQEDLSTVYDIPVGKSYIFGPKDAKVTITEFVDFQCPFCARFHGPVIEAAKAYPKDVRVIIKNFPLSFHPEARPAAKAALAAGEQGKYYEMADKLLANVGSLNADNYVKWAGELGLNVKKFQSDLQSKDAEYEQIIEEDLALGGKVMVRGTPTFYINGRKTTARDLSTYKAEIDKILQGAAQ